jgi:general secretion pathway protein D
MNRRPVCNVIVLGLMLSACAGDSARRADQPNSGVGLLGDRGFAATLGVPSRGTPSAQGSAREQAVGFVSLSDERGGEARRRSPGEPSANEEGVSLNFVDVDAQEFVKVVFDQVLKKPVIVDPSLTGRITVRSGGPISRSAALALIKNVLQVHGGKLEQNGGVYVVSKSTVGSGDRKSVV